MRGFWRLVRALALVAVVAGVALLPAIVEMSMNRVLKQPPYTASARAREIAARHAAVDLHADSLLWSRNLADRSSRGHVDIPRLIDANVALQAFTVVTKTPRGINFRRNTGDSDNIKFLAIASRWPVATWNSLAERALFQASRLREYERRSGGRMTIIRSSADLQRYLDRRRAEPAITAGFLGIEGAHALDGKVENIDTLYDAGFRMMSPSHFFDNDMGGSSAGADQGGLTAQGREMIRRMEDRRMLVDLAHASTKTIDDVLAMARRPVMVSHTGLKGACDSPRNLSDDHLRRIAQGGGIVGIAYFDVAVCGTDARAVARTITHAINVVGVEHVALGSDFDGAVATPFDTTGLPLIVDALLEAGFNESTVAKVMGENALRFLLANL